MAWSFFSRSDRQSKRAGRQPRGRTRSIRRRHLLLFESLEGRRLLDGIGLLDAGTLSITDSLSVATNTGEKPQSKVWRSADHWWSVLPNDTGTWLWRLDQTAWNPVLQLSPETETKADVTTVGDVTHILLYSGTSSQLVSVEYAPSATDGYQLWSVRPELADVQLHAKVETATIDIDSTGRMWLASDTKNEIEVRYSDYPYRGFSDPITLATGIDSDDISVVTALPNGTVGVLWSDQNDERFGFRIHVDGANPGAWAANEVPASQSARSRGAGMADDHVNVAVTSDGTLYAAIKTGYDTSGLATIGLLVRRPSGDWDSLYTVDTIGTRPIVIASEAQDRLVVAYTKSNGGDDILFKESPLGTIAFSARQTLLSGNLNDVTSTKQPFTDELLVMASGGGEAEGALIRIGTGGGGGGGDAGTVEVVDDADTAFVTTGDWREGGLGNYKFSQAGNGTDVASWNFTVAPGIYEVAASWVPYENRATDAPFRVLSGNTELGHTEVNQEVAPNDFSDGGYDWERLGQFTVQGTDLIVQLSDAANEVVIADAVRIEQITGLDVTSPEIAVTFSGEDLTVGGQLDFGDTPVGSSIERQITITNIATLGQDPLLLGPVTLPAASGFTLLDDVAGTSLPPGQSIGLRVVLDAVTGGTFAATLSLGNNDADESPFDLALVGSVSSGAPTFETATVLDDTDPEFSAVGDWRPGGLGDYQFSDGGSGSDVARWSLTVVPGVYEVAASWVPYKNRATDAPYRVLDGQIEVGRVRVNQQEAPDDWNDLGYDWKLLGQFTVEATQLTVELSDDANQVVIADAVRVEQVTGLDVTSPEIAVTINGQDLVDGDQIDFGTTPVGISVERQITVTNAGTVGQDPLVLAGLTLPYEGGFTLLDDISGTTLLPGQSASFRVALSAAATGSFATTLQIDNTDANGDENPFDIGLIGHVQGSWQIVDVSDPGFTSQGDWRAGGLGDYLYNAAGSGADVARWNFAVTPGIYEVAATWVPYENRATDALYRILNDHNQIGLARISQANAPADFSDNGRDWQRLGQFEVDGTQLAVELNDRANNYVIADAVMIQRIGSLPSEVAIGLQKQLLVDNFAIAEMTGITREMGQVTKLNVGQPVSDTWLYPSVQYDQAASVFQMWSSASELGSYVYSESADGVHFTPVANVEGIDFSHLDMSPSIDPHTTDPTRRYVTGFGASPRGTGLAHSADAVHWQMDNGGDSVLLGPSDGTHQITWDAAAGVYRLMGRVDFGAASGSGEIRGVGSYTNPDIETNPRDWTVVQEWKLDREGPDEWQRRQAYAMTDWVYEGVHFGLLSVYEWPLDFSEGTTTDLQTRHERDVINFYLATSRDGVNWDLSWVYTGTPLVPRGGDGAWDKDGVFATAGSIVTHNDQHWIYYAGMNERHGSDDTWMPDRSGAIGGATLRLDGFVGLTAGAETATVTTKQFLLAGNELQLNLDATQGQVRAEMLDAQGEPIEGFTAAESIPMQGVDGIRLTPQWQYQPDLSALQGQLVQLRLTMSNATWYAFQVMP